ncbi:hypothetical protein DUNSADRAFT_5397 [Dunaliella salina]|uniref:GDP-mannose transporter n=1 Tax=Dunaliella salina TaxID=3046 RepID=A0ABQ7FUC9_DUNSA|nr:hypothetical protein DUNSADRAFT_5397 [Dunaliella salina]|eukprot:KAF5826012.1 hypothetical protein DUNSADRAFT_5397 [Dunaliella salina]
MNKDPSQASWLFHAIVAGCCYSFSSGLLTMLNKHALVNFGFSAPNMLLLMQCVLTVLIVKICALFHLITDILPLRKDIAFTWFPVNIIFVCMIGTNVYAMQHVGLGILIVCKNLSNVLTCIGDYVLFGKRYNWNVWASLSVMFASATVGASADKHFTFIGYGWLAANILFTSLYTLLLRGVIGKVKDITAGKPFSDFTLVLYNNALSILPVLLLAIFFDEHKAITLESNLLALSNPSFLIVAAMSGVLGFAISFSSLWFLSQVRMECLCQLVHALTKHRFIPLIFADISYNIFSCGCTKQNPHCSTWYFCF